VQHAFEFEFTSIIFSTNKVRTPCIWKFLIIKPYQDYLPAFHSNSTFISYCEAPQNAVFTIPLLVVVCIMKLQVFGDPEQEILTDPLEVI